ncbi:MAG: histidinol-phosphate transaminase [Candidatus Cyclobacteriaceae bacterium M3_2C_046]
MFDLKKLLRSHFLDLKPYASARDEYSGKEGIFLDANENSLGSVISPDYHRYPDPYQRDLKQALSKIKNVPPQHIFLGNGSDEVIDLMIRLFCQPLTDNILLFPPTYGMYSVSARINQVQVKEVQLKPDFQIDISAALKVIDDKTKLIFVCSPNNPTGNSLNEDVIVSLLDQFNGILILDEAYADFSQQESFSRYLTSYPNLVVMQTFSKAWGLAGLRLGMAYASTDIIHYLNKIKPPYNINSSTQALALKAIENEAVKNKYVSELLQQKNWLSQQLNQLDLVEKVHPSDANFLLVRMKQAQKVYHYLIEQKIIVRDRSNVLLCEDSLRITIGTATENQQLLEQLKSFKIPSIA